MSKAVCKLVCAAAGEMCQEAGSEQQDKLEVISCLRGVLIDIVKRAVRASLSTPAAKLAVYRPSMPCTPGSAAVC